MKQILILMFAILTILHLTSIPSGAAEPFTVVNAQGLKAMMDDKQNATVVIDSRSRGDYDQAHIKGAISIPFPQAQGDMSMFNFPTTSNLVFYCSGST